MKPNSRQQKALGNEPFEKNSIQMNSFSLGCEAASCNDHVVLGCTLMGMDVQEQLWAKTFFSF